MDVVACLVGINGWDTYTKQAIESIKKHEPSVRVVVIDNASDEPYPDHPQAKIVRTERTCYAAAINTAIDEAGDADWYLVLNNDTLCQEPFLNKLNIDRHTVYGRQILKEKGHVWLGIWLALISKEVWKDVGRFDEEFKMCAFEDADYCVRAKAKGIDTEWVNLPFHHYWGKTRWGLPNYPEVREKNIEYFESKHGFRLGDGVVETNS